MDGWLTVYHFPLYIDFHIICLFHLCVIPPSYDVCNVYSGRAVFVYLLNIIALENIQSMQHVK